MAVVEQLYAELLVNIRSITLFIGVDGDSTAKDLQALLRPDRTSLTVAYGDHRCTTFSLPAAVLGDTSTPLRLLPASNREVTCRLALDGDRWTQIIDDEEPLAPWSARNLRGLECAHCRGCRRTVLSVGAIHEWKDLPSENWAEMMDFWHCHKPDEPSKAEHQAQTDGKGYAASNRLTARPGTGLVDTCHLVVSEADCGAISVDNESRSEAPAALLHLVCNGCRAVVGLADADADGFRLFKSSLAVGFAGHTQLELFDVEKWLAARLLSVTEAQSARKIVVASDNASDGHLLVWILTPDFWLTYSSPRGRTSHESIRATKILWKALEDGFTPEKLPESIDVLLLPAPTYRFLEACFYENQQILPSSALKHQDWDITLLRRFLPREVCGPIC